MANTRIAELRPADVILSDSESKNSPFIRMGTLSDVSHAMLYLGDGEIIHATTSIVETVLWNDIANQLLTAMVFRHPRADSDTARRIVSYAKSAIDKKYNLQEALKAHAFQKKSRGTNLTTEFNAYSIQDFYGDRERFFCSQLIVLAYQHGGLPLSGLNPDKYSPEDLKHVKLDYIGDLI